MGVGTLDSSAPVWGERLTEGVKVSVTVQGLQGDYQDDENAYYAYRVMDSGVLQILAQTPPEGDWQVLWEHAPDTWQKVQGTRYIKDTDKLPGPDGSAPRRAEGSGRMMVL